MIDCGLKQDEADHMLMQVQQLSQKQHKKARKGREKDRFGPPLTTRSQGMDQLFWYESVAWVHRHMHLRTHACLYIVES